MLVILIEAVWCVANLSLKVIKADSFQILTTRLSDMPVLLMLVESLIISLKLEILGEEVGG